VFKLERERPAYAVHQNNLFYIKDKYLRVFDFANSSDVSVLSVRKIGGQYVHPRSLSYNPAERAVIITTVSYVILRGWLVYLAEFGFKRLTNKLFHISAYGRWYI
jgi:hypothetical protein